MSTVGFLGGQLSSIIEAVGGTVRVGDVPEHYIDPMHALDGGSGEIHRRLQDGAFGLGDFIAGLDMRCGIIPVAWDDASDDAPLRTEFVVPLRFEQLLQHPQCIGDVACSILDISRML